MNRISRDLMFMKMAEVSALRSTCFRANVGAVLTLNRNVVSVGYNGPGSNEPHCKGNCCELNAKGGCLRSIHAEANAIYRAPADTPLHRCELYVTHQPCLDCAKLIIQSKIFWVYYMHPYREKAGLELLLKEGIAVNRVTPSGYIINEKTNQIIDSKE